MKSRRFSGGNALLWFDNSGKPASRVDCEYVCLAISPKEVFYFIVFIILFLFYFLFFPKKYFKSALLCWLFLLHLTLLEIQIFQDGMHVWE